MKHSILVQLVLVACIFASSLSHAETMYITDSWKFEMRETPCFQCKIVIYGLPSGTKLETTGQIENDWIQVRTRGGTIGWMPKNYLSSTPAARNIVEASVEDAKRAEAKSTLAIDRLQTVTQELSQAGIEIEMIDVSSEDGLVSINAPRIIGNLATLGRQNKQLLESRQILQNQLDLKKAEVDRLEKSELKTFFVYGAAAVLAGALLTVLLPRLKPRRSNSEWA